MTLSRRTLLRGSGVLAFLPTLEALWPARALAADAAPLRFVGVFAPNGMVPEHWKPTTTGAAYALPLSLQPLAPVRSLVSVVSGMWLGPQEYLGSHPGGQKAFLTATDTLTGSSSVDQLIGRATERVVRLPTLNLGIENNGYYWPPQIVANSAGIYTAPRGEDREDRCKDAESCLVSVNAGVSQPNLYHPQVAFERLFGSTGAGGDASAAMAAELREAARRRRVVDALRGHAAGIRKRISATDQQRVDEYLEGVRRIELELDRIQGTGTGTAPVSCDRTTGVTGIPVDRDRYAHLLVDLIVRGFQCDSTRAATLMLGMGVSPMPFVVDGVTYSHHGDASHHGADQTRRRAKGVIDAWMVSVFAYLVQQLSLTRDADNTPLIDRSAVYYGSDIADSDLHNAVGMPVLLAGKLGGALHPGTHFTAAPKTTIGDMFVSVLSAFDPNITSFGKWGTKAMGGL